MYGKIDAKMFQLRVNLVKRLISCKKSMKIHRNFATAAATKSVEHEEKNFQTTWDNAKPFSEVPGPSILQMLRNFLPGGKFHNIELIDMHRMIRDDYGLVAKLPGLMGNPTFVITYDPVDFETLFRTEGIWPNRRGISTFDHYRKNLRPDVFKDMGGLLSEQGETWGKMRTIVNPIMLKPATANAYIPVIDTIAREFIDRIKTLRDDKQEMPANFGYELNKWALESISAVALDDRLHILDASSTDESNMATQLIKAVNDFFELSYELEMKPNLWRVYPTKNYKALMKAFDKMTEATMYYIEQAVIKFENKPKGSSDDNRVASVLEKLLKIDKHIAMIMALDMLMAGVDTTSSTMGSCLYHLAKNPDKQEKLREEVKTILPNLNESLTPDSFRSAPYLRACIKEVQRVIPIIPGTARAAGKDLVIKGYQIPKGTHVATTNMLLQNEETYFKQSDVFMPERWLKESIPGACPAAKATNPFVFMPFGFGVRSCVGRRFAEVEIHTLITRLIRQFRIEFDYGPIKYRTSFVLSPISELKFKLIEN